MDQTIHHPPRLRRILLKLSGEALAGDAAWGLDAHMLQQITQEVKQLVAMKIEVGIVVGGGNLFRGAALHASGLNRVVGDQMGMLATVMNALALHDAFERAQMTARLVSAIAINGIIESYHQRNVMDYLASGKVVIFAAGTGNPFFTTDSAACLRAIEVNAEAMFKATRVDGVFDQDPEKHTQARMYTNLSYEEVINRRLQVMDLTAICLARDHQLPIYVFNLHRSGSLSRIVCYGRGGTCISAIPSHAQSVA